jgi:hypothetical protein
MITITQRGSFDKTERYLNRLKLEKVLAILNKYGEVGVEALSAATPLDSGETAHSWYYTTESRKGYYSIRWHNRHEDGGFPVAVMLQYGHGTGTGGYVQGRDYIMPAMRPIFEEIADAAWKEVTEV